MHTRRIPHARRRHVRRPRPAEAGAAAGALQPRLRPGRTAAGVGVVRVPRGRRPLPRPGVGRAAGRHEELRPVRVRPRRPDRIGFLALGGRQPPRRCALAPRGCGRRRARLPARAGGHPAQRGAPAALHRGGPARGHGRAPLRHHGRRARHRRDRPAWRRDAGVSGLQQALPRAGARDPGRDGGSGRTLTGSGSGKQPDLASFEMWNPRFTL
ncbi:hypothetical protein MICRO8M_20056 [Microbacterium sp. 8M]|nr:hypothetical protein MICRO8M_20056 [Microbacterium sp. 8M]